MSLQELPLLIELRNYIAEKDNYNNFLEYLHKGTGLRGGNLNQKELDDWLKNQSSIVMFDGLDEVLDTRKRENVAIDIINFSITYPKVRVLVTSRVIGYEDQHQKFRDANFRHFMLQDLDEEQICSFVTQWHKLAFGDDNERNKKRDRLQKSIENSRSFRELAGNPLLLTMMAILNRHEELPRDRATLYEHASMVLLQKWDAERNLQDKSLEPKISGYLDYKVKQDMLRKIAYKMQSDASVIGNSLVITGDALEKFITGYLRDRGFNEPHLIAKVLLKQLTDRSFILCFMGGDSYSFVHRTFLEYFCAWYFIWEYEHEKNISLEDLKEKIFAKRWTDEAWREIIILITGKISEKFAAELIDSLVEKDGKSRDFDNLLIACECLQNVRNRSLIKETDRKLLDKLKDLLTRQPGIKNEIRNKVVAVVKATWHDDSETLQWVEALA